MRRVQYEGYNTEGTVWRAQYVSSFVKSSKLKHEYHEYYTVLAYKERGKEKLVRRLLGDAPRYRIDNLRIGNVSIQKV